MGRSLCCAAIAALVALGFPIPAAVASQPLHGEDSGTFTDRNFCGTGERVRIHFETAFSSSERDSVIKTQHRGSLTFTNEAATVILSFAGQFTDTILSRQGGVVVHRLVTKGLPIKIKPERGGVLTRDAGLLVERVTVKNGNIVASEIIRMSGPHPVAQSGGTLFCVVMTDALNLT